jgi:muramoyltetrapeptide carboxypeptidase LdcA involved in peptidoglycan recycling
MFKSWGIKPLENEVAVLWQQRLEDQLMTRQPDGKAYVALIEQAVAIAAEALKRNLHPGKPRSYLPQCELRAAVETMIRDSAEGCVFSTGLLSEVRALLAGLSEDTPWLTIWPDANLVTEDISRQTSQLTRILQEAKLAPILDRQRAELRSSELGKVNF